MNNKRLDLVRGSLVGGAAGDAAAGTAENHRADQRDFQKHGAFRPGQQPHSRTAEHPLQG